MRTTHVPPIIEVTRFTVSLHVKHFLLIVYVENIKSVNAWRAKGWNEVLFLNFSTN